MKKRIKKSFIEFLNKEDAISNFTKDLLNYKKMTVFKYLNISKYSCDLLTAAFIWNFDQIDYWTNLDFKWQQRLKELKLLEYKCEGYIKL